MRLICEVWLRQEFGCKGVGVFFFKIMYLDRVDVFMVLSVPAGVLRVCTLRRFLPTLRITCCISLHDALFLENLVCNNVTAVAEMAVQVKSNLRLVIFFVMRFRNNTFFFYKVVLSVPHLTPNLDSQCIPFFVWVNNFDLSGM